MRYRLEFTQTAGKGLAQLPEQVRGWLAISIAGLADSPRPPTSRQMRGEVPGYRRLRLGEYRIAYHVDDARVVMVVRVGPRGSVYK